MSFLKKQLYCQSRVNEVTDIIFSYYNFVQIDFNIINRLIMKLMLMTVGSLSRSQNQHPFCVYNKVLTLQQNIDIVFFSIYQLIDHPYLVLLCDTCERNISFAVSILAQEKENGEYWDMCTTCFIKHMTKFVHYFVRPSTNFTITEEKWSINSHLMLMQALIV